MSIFVIFTSLSKCLRKNIFSLICVLVVMFTAQLSHAQVSCRDYDLTGLQFNLDYTIRRQRNLIVDTARHIALSNNSTLKLRKIKISAAKKAEIIYSQGSWQVWTSFPQTVRACTDSYTICTGLDLNSSVNALTDSSMQLRDLTLALLAELKANNNKPQS